MSAGDRYSEANRSHRLGDSRFTLYFDIYQ